MPPREENAGVWGVQFHIRQRRASMNWFHCFLFGTLFGIGYLNWLLLDELYRIRVLLCDIREGVGKFPSKNVRA